MSEFEFQLCLFRRLLRTRLELFPLCHASVFAICILSLGYGHYEQDSSV